MEIKILSKSKLWLIKIIFMKKKTLFESRENPSSQKLCKMKIINTKIQNSNKDKIAKKVSKELGYS